VVVVPVSDLDRAKEFYADKLGFHVDHDSRISEDARLMQLTPPGSGCSIVLGTGMVPYMPPGSLRGLQLVVPDIEAAHAELTARGVDVSEVQVLGKSPSPTSHPLDNVGSSSSATRTATSGRCSRSAPAREAVTGQTGQHVRCHDH
jgi:catechol 2,3-dioxygenase-like lactoylglutathione lyase family enzyme